LKPADSNALPFRVPVQGHFSHFVYGFSADLLADKDGRRDLEAVASLDDYWTHWLAEADPGDMECIIDDSYFFLRHLRRLIFPEFVVQRLGGADELYSDDATKVAKALGSTSLKELIATMSTATEIPDYSERAILRLRYLNLESDGINSMITTMNETKYSARLDYIDVCLFPDCRGILVVRLSDFSRLDAQPVTTMELGRLLRQLKGIQFRQRYVVSLSHPVFPSGIVSWASMLDHVLRRLTTRSVTRVTQEGGDSRFRKHSFVAVRKSRKMGDRPAEVAFESNLERMLFEVSTGHATTDSQEVPSASRIGEFRKNMVDQWVNFGALAFWDDVTFYIQDRTGTTDPPPSGGEDGYARVTYPRQVENSYLWMYVLAEYQRATLSDYTIRLVELGLDHYRDLERALAVTNEYLRFRNLYWFRDATPSQFGIAVHAAVMRMQGLSDMMLALDAQFGLVTGQFRMEHDEDTAARSRAANVLLSLLGIVGVPMSIVATVMATSLASASLLKHISARQAWLVFLGAFVVLMSIVGAWMWWSASRITKKRRAHRRIGDV
jgi:hypothetical protein